MILPLAVTVTQLASGCRPFCSQCQSVNIASEESKSSYTSEQTVHTLHPAEPVYTGCSQPLDAMAEHQLAVGPLLLRPCCCCRPPPRPLPPLLPPLPPPLPLRSASGGSTSSGPVGANKATHTGAPHESHSTNDY